MFGTSGIRGPVGETITADLALEVGRAVGLDAASVIVGRDTRESGVLLVDALSAGVREVGADVVDIGVAATPTVARAVGWKGADAGVAVTASHNPPEDNGIKLWTPSGKAFGPDRRATITDRLEGPTPDLPPWDELGRRRHEDVTDRHVRAIQQTVEIDGSPHVVVDLGNGAGTVTVRTLNRLGCRVETLNAQPDGSFPGRPSEPTPEHCGSLTTVVGETDASVGIAHDGDADRTRVVTADGTFLSGDVTLALLAAATADAGEGVAVPVDTSLAVLDYLEERGVSVQYTPVGDVHVAEAATADTVTFGGEPSGAWIWPADSLCPDGPLAAARLVAMDGAQPLGDRAAAVPTYAIRRDSVSVQDKRALMRRISDVVQTTYESVETMDGVRVDLGDAWFLIRASGTEPVVRITAEARDAGRTDAVFQEARELLDAER